MLDDCRAEGSCAEVEGAGGGAPAGAHVHGAPGGKRREAPRHEPGARGAGLGSGILAAEIRLCLCLSCTIVSQLGQPSVVQFASCAGPVLAQHLG